MHFIKTIISLFALSSFTTAHYTEEEQYHSLERRQATINARESYLRARDEYMEKRDLWIRGGGGMCMIKSINGGGKGKGGKAGRVNRYCEKWENRKSKNCGPCDREGPCDCLV